MSAADMMVRHEERNCVIKGETSELTGILSATIMQRNVNERKDSMARLIRSPISAGVVKVMMAKQVMTMLGMITLNKKNPGCRRKCRVKMMFGYSIPGQHEYSNTLRSDFADMRWKSVLGW